MSSRLLALALLQQDQSEVRSRAGVLGVVLEQGYQRAGDDEKLLAFGPIVLDLMKGAAELAETTAYPS